MVLKLNFLKLVSFLVLQSFVNVEEKSGIIKQNLFLKASILFSTRYSEYRQFFSSWSIGLYLSCATWFRRFFFVDMV